MNDKRSTVEHARAWLDQYGPSVENALSTRELAEHLWPMSVVSLKERSKGVDALLQNASANGTLAAYCTRGPGQTRKLYGKERIVHPYLWHRPCAPLVEGERRYDWDAAAHALAASGMAQALELIRDCTEPDYRTRSLRMQKIAADALKVPAIDGMGEP